ncbi:Nudix family hydrolase [Microbacterium sp.]|uniref:Nudix family hydrolase n=1 Tax=Microbacterium sp. TaxID=51671 RepID=UPI002735229A|nr:Nudix family hydrolase [Microbacterium sp.]
MAGLMLASTSRALSGRPVVDVAVGVLGVPDGRILLAERREGTIGAGFWELPGGKVEAGEDAAQAVARELLEEVGVQALDLGRARIYEHQFPTRRVRVHCFPVHRWSGEPWGKERQRLAWVDPQQLDVGPLLPSLELAVSSLGLPELVAVADVGRAAGAADQLLQDIASMAAAGLRFLIVRAREFAPSQRVLYARRLREASHGSGLRTLLSGTALEARHGGMCGLHSSSAALVAARERPPTRLWAVSAHDAAGLERADALGAQFALVSPVLQLASHPSRPALGWDGLRRLTATTPLPVYAQGGVGPDDLQKARAAGAWGVAVDVASLREA